MFKQKNKNLIIVCFLIITSIFMISLGAFLTFDNTMQKDNRVQTDNNLKEENNFSSFKYVCVSKLNLSKKQVIMRYEATVDQKDNITYFYEEKKYVFFDLIEYSNALYSTSTRNVSYEGNKDELTITIYGNNGKIINELGEVITPNYLEYLNQYIDDSYKCQIIQ